MAGSMSCIRVSIEGNIASGKTTLIKALASLGAGYNVVEQKLDYELNNETWESLLSDIKNNYCRNSVFKLQRHILDTFLHPDYSRNAFVVTETSPASVKIFNAAHKSVLHSDDRDILDNVAHNIWMPNHIIYLRASPALSAERAYNRSRLEKRDLEFIGCLDSIYEGFIASTNIPVSILDASQPPLVTAKLAKKIIDNVFAEKNRLFGNN